MVHQVRKYSKAKKIFLVFIMIIVCFAAYVEIVNLKSKNMTYRQKVLKAVYPLWMWYGKIRGKNNLVLKGDKEASQSFYSLSAEKNNGTQLNFEELRGKKVLIVNTASDCGYTNQYNDLQELSEKYASTLVVLGFPANDFKQQEKRSDAEIAEFCKLNFGVSFPLMKKTVVIKSSAQHPVFKWLTDSSLNGWNYKQPSWNFCKYLVDEKGRLKNYFGATISPLSKEVIKAIGE
jgi:glutathione peroxidase